MSVQPTSYLPGARLVETSGSDFQQMVSRVLTILRQRRWLFVLPLLTGLVIGLAGSLFLPRRYVLSSLFERRDDVVITNLLSTNSPYSFETLRRSLPIDLIGYNALSEASEQLGLLSDLPREADGTLTAEGKNRRQALISRLSRQVDVSLVEKSTFLDLIEVRYTGPEPDLGVKLATRLKDNYIARTRERIGGILSKAHAFFSEEAGKRKEKAAQMEAELLQMAVQHPGVDPSDPGVLDQRLLNHNLALEELGRRKAEHQTRLKACEEYLAQLEGRPAAPGSVPVRAPAAGQAPNPQRTRIMQEMERVRGQIMDAKTLRNMTDEHPAVVGLRGKLDELASQLAVLPETISMDAPAGAGDPGLTALQAEQKRVTAEIKSLEGLLAQIAGQTQRHEKEKRHIEEEKGKLFERRQTFLTRQQELSTAKTDLKVWQGHVETLSRVLTAAAEARGIQFATLDEARRPARPVSPTFAGIILVSITIGVAMGTAAVFLREVLDRSIRSVQRVRETLSIPVLETMGEIRSRRGASLMMRRLFLPAMATVQTAVVAVTGVLAYLSVEQPLVYDRLVSPLRHVLPI